MLKFSVRVEGGPERTVEVEDDVFEVGSDESLPLRIDDPAAAPRHLKIEVRGQNVVLRDLGTETGTKVNGSHVAQVRIAVGDSIEVGATKITFLVQGAAEPVPAPVPEDTPEPTIPDGQPVVVARPAAKGASRAPLLAERRRSSMLMPVLALALLALGAGAGFYLLEYVREEPTSVATLSPAEVPGDTSPPAEPPPIPPPSPEEPAPVDPGVEIPPEAPVDDPEVVVEPEPEPEAPEPEPETPEPETPAPETPEPGPAAPGPEAAPPPEPEPSAEEEFRREQERLVQEAGEKLRNFEETLPDRILRYAFEGPILDLETLLESVPESAVREDVAARLVDIAGARGTFDRFRRILAASKGKKITLSSGLTLVVTETDETGSVTTRVSPLDRVIFFVVTETDETGFRAKVGPAVTKKKWTELDPPAIHDAVADEISDAEAWLELAAFASLYELPDEAAELDLLRAYRRDKTLKPRVDATIARWRGIDNPSGGFVLHEGRWVTSEEKRYLDDGYVKHGGRWMTRDEVMAAKGYVQHEGRWLSPEDYQELLGAQREAEELAKKFLPKGLIDKPGLTPQVDWADAPTLKKGNYKIKTNLGKEVANDISYTMEMLRMNFKLIFGFRKRIPKLTVSITANRQEFRDAWPGPGRFALGFFTSGNICTFYQPPMTTSVLMHEGTHEFLHKYAPSCPRWLHEGVATFFECSKFDFDAKKKRVTLRVGLLNSMRLASFQRQLNNDKVVSLESFIRGKGGDPYAQGWAFVYYLAKGKDGQYSKRLHEFVKQSSASSKAVKNFRKIFRIRDLAAFEQEWREYMMSLNPADGVSLSNQHR
ncbi:MAG: FHA domain-containing protein [Planctomycetota bacterium]